MGVGFGFTYNGQSSLSDFSQDTYRHESFSSLQAIRSGNYPVVIEDHVLILNWNRQTPSLLRQLALASKEAEARSSKKRHVRNERSVFWQNSNCLKYSPGVM